MKYNTNSLRSTWTTWKNTTPSPPSPPHQKYLENAKKVKKTTKSEIFLVIYYMYVHIADVHKKLQTICNVCSCLFWSKIGKEVLVP